MKSPFLKTLLSLVLQAAVLVLAIGGWVFYHRPTEPTLAGNGGTVLVYEIDTDVVISPSTRSEELVDALLRRLDPDGTKGITARTIGGKQVEIGIPRSAKRQEEVEQAKELLAHVGTLEFRILANERDDFDGIRAARDYIDDPAKAAELNRLAEKGLPPPQPLDGKAFDWINERGEGHTTYSWVELGKHERKSMNLDNAAENDTVRSGQWKSLEHFRNAGKAALLSEYGNLLLYSRKCVNAKMSGDDRDAKKYEYFVLTRDPEPGKRISGDYLATIFPTDQAGKPAISFSFNPTGGDLLWEVTSNNQPNRSEASPFRRHLAILLDGSVQTAPTINSPIREHGIITGKFTKKEVDNLVEILRSGALPATLKPIPVSETTVEPAK